MLSTWLVFTRPKTLVASIMPVVLGTSLVYAYQHHVSFVYFLLTLLASLFIQIGTNFANDYYDNKKNADTKERKGPKRALQEGLISLTSVKIAFLGCFSIAFILGIVLVFRGGIPILLIGILSILLGIFYTKGKYALSYIGISDLFVIVFFGPIAIGGTYYVQTLQINIDILLWGISFGFLCLNLLVINHIRDYDTDKKANKKTLVVKLGQNFGKWEVYFSYMVSLIIPLYFILTLQKMFLLYIFILIPLYLYLASQVAKYRSVDLNKVLSLHGVLLFFYSGILSIIFIVLGYIDTI